MSRAARPAGAALWTTRLDRASPVSLSRQLASALRGAVAEGSLGAASRLPSTRALASDLGLARSTVVVVFEQLAAEGYIAAKPGSGYFVPPRLVQPNGSAAPARRAASRLLSRQAALLSVQPGVPRRQRPFELGHAEIDGRLIASWKRLAAHALSGRTQLNWSYGDPQGEPVLRRAVAEYLAAARGVRCGLEQIVLTSGSQQGLSLTARILLDPGAAAIIEDPCYRSAFDILRAAEAEIVPVPVDECGLDIAAAPRLRPPPRLVYTTPSRQYPLGMAMPLDRRLALLAWAEREGVWIIEDDYESEFQHPAEMLPSLQGLDRAGRVIYLGTFSKLVFPSLRLGYAVLPEDLVAPFTAARQLADRQSSGLIQAIMTEFMLEGHFARHLKRMRALYAERRGFLTDLLAHRLGGLLETAPNESGMYLVAWLPSGWDDRAVAARLDAAGVTAAPLSALTLATKRRPALVLGHTGHSEAAMARAVARIAEALQPRTGLPKTRKAELRSDQPRR